MIKIGNTEITSLMLGGDEITKIYVGNVIEYEPTPPEPPTPEATPLTFEITSPGNIVWKSAGSQFGTKTIQYSKNGGSWTSISSSTGGTAISVVSGDTVQFRGDNAEYRCGGFYNSTAGFNLKGNIMSLINSTNFSGLTTLQSANTFEDIFDSCTGLTDASELLLPSTTLATACYSYMFNGCESLTTAPELPATTLADYCYRDMFQSCYSLTGAPNLPSTTLADNCYYFMFAGCSNLTTAPVISATTLAKECCAGMFNGCESLTGAPVIAATTLASNCCSHMFSNCTSLTTAPSVLPATTLAEECYSDMFAGCTSLTVAPVLPATTLTGFCYSNMFQGCESLEDAPSLPATTLAEGCYYSMFESCTSLTGAPVLPSTTLVDYCYSNMFNGCNNLEQITCYAEDWSNAQSPFGEEWDAGWVSDVAENGTFYRSSGSTVSTWDRGTFGIPNCWTAIPDDGMGDCEQDCYEECDGDPECECMCDGGEWDWENQECLHPEPTCEEQGLCDDGAGNCVECEQDCYAECEGDPECECGCDGGEWDPENQECLHPE